MRPRNGPRHGGLNPPVPHPANRRHWRACACATRQLVLTELLGRTYTCALPAVPLPSPPANVLIEDDRAAIMKSARRHELQTNWLADHLGQWLQESQPVLTKALVAIAAVAAIVAAYLWYSSSKQQSQAEAWRSFVLALSGQDTAKIQSSLENVASDYGDSSAALWALVISADVDLGQGMQALFSDKANAINSLSSAAEKYEQVLTELGDGTSQPLLRQRALFGLAQAKEGLGEVDEAIKYYKQAADVDANAILTEQAKKRTEMLAQNDMKRWYFWFKRQEPKPPSAERPASGLPGSLPLMDDLSDFPDLGKARDTKSSNDGEKKGEAKKGEGAPEGGTDKDKASPPKETQEPASSKSSDASGKKGSSEKKPDASSK